MQLKSGTLLKGGEYKIEKVLGQGGFGITYLGEQVSLKRKVAIKEFFMKEYCNRDMDTSHVSVPSVGSKELVGKFREKFVKEAQNIAGLNHSNIIKVHDVFEENNTAYYVMEYLDCGSLSDYVAGKGRLSEAESEVFIKQIASALSYIHERKINHLDVKPGNILLDENNNAVLIDFGLSKHYTEDGGQTSSTPVGISHGYAPLEQYKQGGVSTFSPSTDIYSLGATLYKLLTGTTPPEADDVNENGLSFPSNVHISESMKKAIAYAMQPKRKDRPQSIEEFLKALEVKKVTEDEGTDIEIKVKPDPKPNPTPTPNPVPAPNPTPRPKSWVLYVVVAIVLGIGVCIVSDIIKKDKAEKERIEAEERAREESESKAQKEAMYAAKREYLKMIEEGDKLLSSKKYSESVKKYELALSYEEQYMGTEYSKEFDKGASSKIEAANEAERAYKAEQARIENARLEKERKEREAAEKARLEKEKKEREAAEKARLEKERKEREAAEKARLDKERQQPGTAEYNRTHGSKIGHEWVDLGLPSGIKWATCNVGASRPEDYGYYFAWGETREKSSYDIDNSVTNRKDYGDIGGDSRYDAAKANWGGSWRLPTKGEMEELEENCTWSWTTQGGKRGYKVTGPNGNSIFLPAAGYRGGSSLYNEGFSGHFWSSTPGDDYYDFLAYELYFYNNASEYVDWRFHRNNGLTVRPVSE